ncbi:YkgJ family cysteine cluster protein [soil metagenome]
MTTHPCLSCGACCAFFRVSFHWNETLPISFAVPLAMTNATSAYQNSMNGTEKTIVRCAALHGVVGESVACGIYANRPSPCRDFKASFEDGTSNEACDRARLSKGLARLSLETWILAPAV